VQKRNLVPTRLEVTSIATGGEGLAHVVHGEERRAVFVPRGAPGDVLEAKVDFASRPARATAIRLIEPSALRASAPCPYVERCGGCDFMHLAVEAQRAAHRDIVEAALRRAVASAPTEEARQVPGVVTHAAARDLGYRTRARLAVMASGGRATVGYRRAASHRIEEVETCAVLDRRFYGVWQPIRDLFAGERGEGEVSLALGRGGTPVLEIQWAPDLTGAFFGRLESCVDRGITVGAEVWQEGAKSASRIGDPRAFTMGADGEPLEVPAGGFAQAHPEMNRKLGERIAAMFPFEGQDVAELFAGSGNLTVVLARRAKSLLAVEADPRAVEAARVNLEARGLTARVVQSDADAFEIPRPVRVVLLDPPRAGAHPACEKLARSRIRAVAYVSCDVSTLARDTATLAAGGFALTAVEVFEMFPHTSHVETLVLFDRNPQKGRR
jgi:23S rRNA (uracil1939-C5)-methyltransferase